MKKIVSIIVLVTIICVGYSVFASGSDKEKINMYYRAKMGFQSHKINSKNSLLVDSLDYKMFKVGKDIKAGDYIYFTSPATEDFPNDVILCATIENQKNFEKAFLKNKYANPNEVIPYFLIDGTLKKQFLLANGVLGDFLNMKDIKGWQGESDKLITKYAEEMSGHTLTKAFLHFNNGEYIFASGSFVIVPIDIIKK